MVIETTYLVGTMEPLDETLRYYFSSNWDPTETNSITPIFLSPHGKDSQAADLTTEVSQADINANKAKALILFQAKKNLTLENASNAYRTLETSVEITIYGRTKYEMFLFINHFNDIIQENMPKGNFRIKKSDGIQDSAIAYFKQRKGIEFSQPLVQEKKGHVYVSTGFLSCMWIKTKTS